MSEDISVTKITHFGISGVNARPMSRNQFYEYTEEPCPWFSKDDEDGYLIQPILRGIHRLGIKDHRYMFSWMQKDLFERTYSSVDGMRFEHALSLVREGKCITGRALRGPTMTYIKLNADGVVIQGHTYPNYSTEEPAELDVRTMMEASDWTIFNPDNPDERPRLFSFRMIIQQMDDGKKFRRRSHSSSRHSPDYFDIDKEWLEKYGLSHPEFDDETIDMFDSTPEWWEIDPKSSD